MAAHGLYTTVGSQIAKVRKQRGLTQAQLATAVSLTRTSITNIEQGNQKLLLHTLYAIAAALGTDPVALLPAEGRAPQDEPLDVELPHHLSDDEKHWIRGMVSDTRRRY